jgi:hypothetical protein
MSGVPSISRVPGISDVPSVSDMSCVPSVSDISRVPSVSGIGSSDIFFLASEKQNHRYVYQFILETEFQAIPVFKG